ncbi:lasso peptide biosynthesis PqqD family chaperone [Paenibacillus sp. PAMC21692]|uniref:lasso peptide biosynthesis PqqD family chaperone n=1 Tax=Paenibacillus sp. PAMC21692 TaxID=2762320 RepID=UPI00164EB9DE|nr:lasso peptide biosynthesis PqqD family chaperone [Paenibacillus sp. PAMC21692]QNK59903.1 lasso peptide biosynthesis PqqD family chaperone [Paenibacillus sp. PAMC21692]
MIETTPLALSDLVSSCKDNIVSNMGGEKVMLSIKTGNYYNLGNIGGYIWDGIATPVTVGALIDALTVEFAVGAEQCEEQVISFLEQLRKEGLILVNEENKSVAIT